MAKTLDQLISEAKDALNKAEDGSDEKKTLIGRVEALTSMQQEGINKTQDDLNRVDKQAKEGYETSIKETLGMTLDEFKGVMADVESSLDEGGTGGEEGSPLERMQSALQERDTKIEGLSSSLTDINRRYATDKVDVALERAFLNAKLDKNFLTPAKSLASYSDLVEKAAKGEEVTAEEISAKVEGVKQLSGVWFGAEGDEGDGTVVGGHRIREEAIGIPATPEARQSSEITDEDREKRASSVY